MQVRGFIKYPAILSCFLLSSIVTSCSFWSVTKLEQGLQNYDEGKYYSAVYFFTRAIWEDPVNAELYFYRGNSKSKLKNYKDALLDYTRALGLEPKMKYFENRGLTYLEVKEYELAIDDFNSALTFEDDNARLHFNSGYTNAKLGNYEKAIEEYTLAISIDSTFAKALVNRGDLLAASGEHPRAINDFSQAISLNNVDELAFYNRAKSYTAIGKFQMAIEDYSSAIKLNPLNTNYYFLKAELLAGQGDFINASENYSIIISLDPSNGNAYYNRGICYANLDQKESACEDFNRAGELGFYEAYEVMNKFCKKIGNKK